MLFSYIQISFWYYSLTVWLITPTTFHEEKLDLIVSKRPFFLLPSYYTLRKYYLNSMMTHIGCFVLWYSRKDCLHSILLTIKLYVVYKAASVQFGIFLSVIEEIHTIANQTNLFETFSKVNCKVFGVFLPHEFNAKLIFTFSIKAVKNVDGKLK